MGSLFRYIAKTLIWLIIFAGIIVAALRITLANVDLFRADIETWIAGEIGPGISFGEMRCYWIGINPVLELETATITLPDRRKALAVDAVNIQFNLWGSLVLGIPVVAEISGNIETVAIRKDLEKRWWFNDIQLVAEKSAVLLPTLKICWHLYLIICKSVLRVSSSKIKFPSRITRLIIFPPISSIMIMPRICNY